MWCEARALRALHLANDGPNQAPAATGLQNPAGRFPMVAKMLQHRLQPRGAVLLAQAREGLLKGHDKILVASVLDPEWLKRLHIAGPCTNRCEETPNAA